MPMINLLPWRAELRQKRKKDFVSAVLAAVLFAGGTVYATKLFMQGRIDAQIERNDILRAEIAKLDEQIAEIRNLQTQRDRLVARMEVIDSLQRSRPEIVHVFDELVNMMPDGMYLRTIKQQQHRIEITGVAESNGRISRLLRNIEASPWFRRYDDLDIVNSTETGRAEFSVKAEQAATEQLTASEASTARPAAGQSRTSGQSRRRAQ